MGVCRREADRQKRVEEARAYAEAERMAQQAAGEAGDDEIASDSEQEEEEEVLQADDLFCIACDKIFKSQGAFSNHQR